MVIDKITCYLRDSVDIGLMPGKCLSGLATPDIPQFCGRITSTRYEDVLVGAEGQTKLFKNMSNIGKRGDHLAQYTYLITSPV